jgi:hypothetical protein
LLAVEIKNQSNGNMMTTVLMVLIQLFVMAVSKSTSKGPHCQKSEACSMKTLPTGEYPQCAVVNNEKKILMDWTPKADSSNAVAMFMHDMGFKFGVQYHRFSHTFHHDHFVDKCGTKTACMYLDPTWFRFKVVRNPYSRAVSSYLHCLRHLHFRPEQFFKTAEEYEELSFLSFLKWIKSLKDFNEYCDGHFQRQSYFYEIDCYEKGVPLFHEIVPVENSSLPLQRINAKLGTHYELVNNTYSLQFSNKWHAVTKSEAVQEFVGTKAYKQIKAAIPRSYSLFYNQHIKDLVKEIYYQDIFLYNYSFPFPELGWSD